MKKKLIIRAGDYKRRIKKAQEFNETGEDQNKIFYISIYEVGRAYGGPEEGGWWYDTYEYVETVGRANGREQARQIRNNVEEKLKGKNVETGPLWSAKGFENLPEGTEDSQIPRGFSGEASELQAVIEERPGEKETQERPHYQ